MNHFLFSTPKHHSMPDFGKTIAFRDIRVVILSALVGLLAIGGLYLSGLGLVNALFFVLMSFLSLGGIVFFLSLWSGLLSFDQSEGDFLYQFLEDLPYGVLLTNQKGHILFANEYYLSMTGSTHVRIPTVTTLFGRETGASSAIYRLSKAIKKGQNWSEEFRIEPRNRPENSLEKGGWYRCSVRRFSLSEAVVQNQNSVSDMGSHYTLWEIVEISQERQRQEKTFKNMNYIIDNLAHAPAGFFASTKSGRISYINETLSQWLGFENREDMGTLMLSDLFFGEDEALLTLPNCKDTQKKENCSVQEMDLDLTHYYGNRIPVRLYSEAVIDETTGQYSHRRTLVMRKGEAKNNNDALEVLQLKYNRLFLTSPVPVATIDKDGVILTANALFLRLFDDEGDQIIFGDTVMKDIVNKDARSRLMKAIGLLRAKQSSELDVTFGVVDTSFHHSEQRDGKLFFSPLVQTEGSQEAALVFAMDLTEQRTMEMQIAQGHKMAALGQFAGGIAHDFNNVLQAIIGFSELLLQDHTPKDAAFKDIISIKNNATRAAGLVRQILAFSRGQTLRTTVFSLNDVLPDLDNVLRLNEKVHREVHLGRDLWPVKADRTQFEQVVLNLAKNAMDAMPDGGNISISTSNVTVDDIEAADMVGMISGDFVLCEVSDSGTGIAPEILAKIFEPFFTTKEMGKGTGLGLSSVYGIIKQSEGFIYPESVLGEGTSFRIYLPRYIEEEQALPKISTVLEEGKQAGSKQTKDTKRSSSDKGLSEKPANDTGNEVILLVEDEEAVRSFSARALASRGYEVLEAEDGEHAMEVYEDVDGDIDLVISDVMMPIMDGPTLLAELRQINPDLKAILMSGYAEDSTRKQMDGDVEFVFLNKPFQLKELISTIKDTLNT